MSDPVPQGRLANMTRFETIFESRQSRPDAASVAVPRRAPRPEPQSPEDWDMASADGAPGVL